jgi:iron(III) transport system permease protein
MTRWRLGLAFLLLVTVALPALFPFVELIQNPDGWRAWREVDRLAALASTTLVLIAGTLALALPVGVVGAILLYRSDLPLRQWLKFIVFLSLFVPLPLFTTAWQAALGTTGWLPVGLWTQFAPGDPDVSPEGIAVKPWAYGLGPAIFVHAIAGLPWVMLLVGQALTWVERELEEDMLTVVGPWRVLWSVTLPRCRVAIFAAGLWISLQAATEITVTDVMQVRTFAEEVYNQIVVGDKSSVVRAVATAVPMTLIAAVLVLLATRRWGHNLPALNTLSPAICLIHLGRSRSLVFTLTAALVLLLAAVPVGSLIWKTGLAGSPATWSAEVALKHLTTVIRTNGGMVVQSVGWAMAAGFITTAVGLLTCWLARESQWFHALALGLVAVCWAVAGPIIGLGLADLIFKITYPHWLAVALYYGPSPLPPLWAQFIRFLPCAIALLWPVVRLIPGELLDLARVDGASPHQELGHVVLPITARFCAWAALAVAVLSLSEISAGKIVATAGGQTFAHEVFIQMHYGVSNDLAAMCLLLLGIIVAGGMITIAAQRLAIH